MPITKATRKCSSGEVFTSFQRMKQKKTNLKLQFQHNKQQESRLCQVRRGKDSMGGNLLLNQLQKLGEERKRSFQAEDTPLLDMRFVQYSLICIVFYISSFLSELAQS